MPAWNLIWPPCAPLTGLFVGHVGSSNAFEISQRLGMDQSVIDLPEAMWPRRPWLLRTPSERRRSCGWKRNENGTRRSLTASVPARRPSGNGRRFSGSDEELKRAKGMLDKALSELEQARQVAEKPLRPPRPPLERSRSREPGTGPSPCPLRRPGDTGDPGGHCGTGRSR